MRRSPRRRGRLYEFPNDGNNPSTVNAQINGPTIAAARDEHHQAEEPRPLHLGQVSIRAFCRRHTSEDETNGSSNHPECCAVDNYHYRDEEDHPCYDREDKASLGPTQLYQSTDSIAPYDSRTVRATNSVVSNPLLNPIAITAYSAMFAMMVPIAS